MTATEELIAEVVRLPWALGNAVLALDTLFTAIDRERHTEKRLLYAALAELVSGGARLFTQAERRWLRERLDGRVEPAKLAGEVEALKRLVELAPAVEEAPVPAGQVNVLCVSSAPFLGAPFGVVQRLDVQRFRTAEGPVLNRKADDQAVFLGFRAGVIAGQAYILRRALGDELFAPVLGEGDTFKGEFPNLPSGLPVNGPSLGLGAAMAVVSLMLDLPLPGDVAFTGEIDVHGTLARVTGIPEKLRAAADKGIRVAYLPSENAGDVPTGLVDVCARRTLEQVVTEIFDNASVAGQLGRLRAAAGPVVGPAPSPGISTRSAGGSPRVLLTWASKADPIGRYLDRQRRSKEEGQEEGPILTICSVRRPTVVHVLYTTGPERENDLSENAEAVCRSLRQAHPECTVSPHKFDDLQDPTDYVALVDGVDRVIQAIGAETPGAEYLVNLSSGTPQMKASWLILHVWRRLLGAKLVQVREGRYAKAESRVREVELRRPERGEG